MTKTVKSKFQSDTECDEYITECLIEQASCELSHQFSWPQRVTVGGRWTPATNTGLFVATMKELLFVDTSMWTTSQIDEMFGPLDDNNHSYAKYMDKQFMVIAGTDKVINVINNVTVDLINLFVDIKQCEPGQVSYKLMNNLDSIRLWDKWFDENVSQVDDRWFNDANTFKWIWQSVYLTTAQLAEMTRVGNLWVEATNMGWRLTDPVQKDNNLFWTMVVV